MAKEYARTQRVAEQMQRELAELVQQELKDPRIGLLTLTGVEVSSDYAHAKVFFTMMGDAEAIEQARQGLGHAAGFLRRELGRRIKLRNMPQLHFIHDVSVERGMYLSRLIDAAVAGDTGSAPEEA